MKDNTKNGAWPWTRLPERFGRDSGVTSFTEVFQHSWPSEKPFQDVWRELVKKVSKHPQGSLSSRAIEQLTISALSRHGQQEFENHLRLRAPVAWQDIQTQVEKSLHNLSSTVTTTNLHQCCQYARVVEAKHIKEKIVGTKMRLARLVANEDTWQRFVEVQPHRHKKRQFQGYWLRFRQRKNDYLKTCLCCGKEGHPKADCKFQTATFSICGKVGHLRAVCRNTNTHEIEKDADEPSPEVTVEAFCCMAVQDTVEDVNCEHIEIHEGRAEHRDGSKIPKSCLRTARRIKNSEKLSANSETDQNLEEWSRRSRWTNKTQAEDRELTDQ